MRMRLRRDSSWTTAALLGWLAPAMASADTLAFEHTGRGGGWLDGLAFRTCDFVITAIIDSNDVQCGPSCDVEHLSVSIWVEDIGTLEVLSPPTRTFLNTATIGFGRANGGDFYNGPGNAALLGWGMTTPIGPVGGTGAILQWAGLPQVLTNRGVLEFSNGTCDAVFRAYAVPCPGDLDGSGAVDLADLTTLLSNFGTLAGATAAMGDLDGDGDVDLNDLTSLMSLFGTSCP